MTLPQPDAVPYCRECEWIIGPTGCGCGKDLRLPRPRVDTEE